MRVVENIAKYRIIISNSTRPAACKPSFLFRTSADSVTEAAGLIPTRLVSQAKHAPSLSRGRDRAVEFTRNPHRSLDQLRVAFGFLSPGIVDIIFQADTNMPAH